MRAEEGDESIEDYAAEGEQTLNRIKDTQSESGNPLTRIGRRLLRLIPGGSRD
ncbi:hypothetical protein [Mycobacterium asiaticum]|uniref:hypothetical protein n=1 Tax=Mycobacterium asiaticum TaxID=1790 RepID=UPI000AEEB8C3|nr:hypothetical protein [Mycobacterium asiaticum]